MLRLLLQELGGIYCKPLNPAGLGCTVRNPGIIRAKAPDFLCFHSQDTGDHQLLANSSRTIHECFLPIDVERFARAWLTNTIMNEDEFSPESAQAGAFRITIEVPSIVLTKTGNGYQLMVRNDGSTHHLSDCSDLWDVADNLHHYLHLTPALLSEIHAFRKKCAELRWDDGAVANHYASAARAAEAAARQKRDPQRADERAA